MKILLFDTGTCREFLQAAQRNLTDVRTWSI